MNNTYNRLLELVIDEISLKFGAKAAGRVLGKADDAVIKHTAAQKKKEIVNNPGGGVNPSDPDYSSANQGWRGGSPTPKTQAHKDAEDYQSRKVDQARRIKDKFKARAAAEGSGSGGGRRGSGTKDREGKAAGIKFSKIQTKTRIKTRRKLGSGAGRIRSLFGKYKARKYSKTDDAHKEHFNPVIPAHLKKDKDN